MSMAWLQVLILIVVANAAPVLVRGLFKQRAAWPVDGGRLWRDGRPWFGRSKTIRGLVVAVLAAAAVAPLLAVPVGLGVVVGGVAMLGDLLASFIKRRANLHVSSRATGLDQIPESLLPALVVAPWFNLSFTEIAVVVVMFFVMEVTFSPLLHRLGLRRRPY